MFRIGRIAGPQQAAGAHLGVMEGLHIVFFSVFCTFRRHLKCVCKLPA